MNIYNIYRHLGLCLQFAQIDYERFGAPRNVELLNIYIYIHLHIYIYGYIQYISSPLPSSQVCADRRRAPRPASEC